MGRLFDAVVERISKSFWDKDLLAASGWERRAAEARQSVIEAPSHTEAARRINALLGELRTSHTGLLTPDDVEYYILLDVFSGGSRVREFVSQRFWGGGVRYAGVGFFSARSDGRDFVDAVLEGSPAERAGLKVGDEILSVDAAAYHPIRSFRGKIGDKVRIATYAPRGRRRKSSRSRSSVLRRCRLFAMPPLPARASSSGTGAASATCTCGPRSASDPTYALQEALTVSGRNGEAFEQKREAVNRPRSTV